MLKTTTDYQSVAHFLKSGYGESPTHSEALVIKKENEKPNSHATI